MRPLIPMCIYYLSSRDSGGTGLANVFDRGSGRSATYPSTAFSARSPFDRNDFAKTSSVRQRQANVATYRAAISGNSSSGAPSGRKDMTASTISTQYHLVWSKGFLMKTLVTTLILFLVRSFLPTSICLHDVTRRFGSIPVVSAISNVVIPLVASACCLLQLLLNLLSIGCAGFNAVLGPIRPYFISLVFVLTVDNAWTAGSRRFLLGDILRWGVALMPEILYVWTVTRSSAGSSVKTKSVRNHSILRGQDVMSVEATVVLDIPSMGCVACVNSIDSSLRNVEVSDSIILDSRSYLYPRGRKGGYATVHLAAVTENEVHEQVRRLVDAVRAAGFEECAVSSLAITM